MAFAARKPITQETMEGVRRHMDKSVTVEYVRNGRIEVAQGSLLGVDDFISLTISARGRSETIEFLGRGTAIRSITAGSMTVYDNTANIPANYDAKYSDRIRRMREASFGGDRTSFEPDLRLVRRHDEFGRSFTGQQWARLRGAIDRVDAETPVGSSAYNAVRELKRIVGE